MLRITTIHGDGSAATLKLEGKLLEPWIGELLAACRQSSAAAGPVTLDLTRLSYVDAPGSIALRDLRCRGATLIGCTPLVAELLKENDR